jgi:hypothetical protein
MNKRAQSMSNMQEEHQITNMKRIEQSNNSAKRQA